VEYADPDGQIPASPTQRLRLFELLAENAPDGIAVVRLDGTITYANPAFQHMLKADTSLVGTNADQVILDPPEVLYQLIEQVATHGNQQVVLTYRRRDGSTFPGQLSAIRITDEQGTLWALAGIVRDITEHLQMQAALEAALTQSRDMLQEFVDNLPGIVYVYDLQHRCQLVNRQFLEFWECDADQVLGRLDVEHLPPTQLAEWYAVEQQILASGCPVTSEDRRRDKHQHRTFLSIKFPLYDVQGQIYAIGGISTDITERKQMEDALRASTERLRLFESLVEHAPDAISVLALDGTVQYANPSYQTRYHQDAPLQGQAVDTLYQDDPQQVQAMLHEARATGFWAGVLTHRGPDGQSFPAHVTAFAIRDAAGQTSAIATFVRDLSEQMRQEQERLALQTHIIAAQRAAIRDLSAPQHSGVGEHLLAQAHQQVLIGREQEQRRIARELHDGAVQQLIGISYRLVEIRQSVNGLEHVDAQRSEALTSALEATRWQLLTLVSQMRRLISELRPAGLEELGLPATLTSYVEQLQREDDATLPAIAVQLAELALPAPHALCLFRVAQEALRNAIQHAHARHIWIVLRQEDTGVQFQVRDDGRGFVVPPHLSDLMHANHFGLVGMSERVAWLGGQFAIQTHPGSGTTITVQLPLERDSNNDTAT
jgi:PAS domain S-box-containing protein